MTPEEHVAIGQLPREQQRAIGDFLDLVLSTIHARHPYAAEPPDWFDDDERLCLAPGAGAAMYGELLRNLDCRHQSVGDLTMRVAGLRDEVKAMLTGQG